MSNIYITKLGSYHICEVKLKSDQYYPRNSTKELYSINTTSGHNSSRIKLIMICQQYTKLGFVPIYPVKLNQNTTYSS